MIKQCSCGDYRAKAATFQNDKYGYGMRVKNPCKKEGHQSGFRCTVCGIKE